MKNIIITNNSLKAEISQKGAAIERLFFDGTEIGKDGIVVGRYANRIAGGRLIIDGKEYQLSRNEGANTLHGGTDGFGEKVWETAGSADDRAVLKLSSPDNDQGFPGSLEVSVSYTITKDNALVIEYAAESSKPTVINLTNHLYFNLNGGGTAEEHILRIDADAITETDSELIPTGIFTDVSGTRFDFRTARNYTPDYDDNYVLNGEGFREAAELAGERSGIHMKVFTDQPGVQLYNTRTHICLETQHFADSPDKPQFPSTILRPGEIFRSKTVYAFYKL